MTTKKSLPVSFPKKFLWGTSTSAHQSEGGTHNQWTVWELENAKSLAHQAQYKLDELPRWQAIKAEATDPDNYVAGKAIDHYNRYEKDFDIVKAMNMNSFRFSIEWSRVEPSEGAWDAEQIEHYRKYIARLVERGIEPVVTLWHWTLPVWFSEKGGFEKYNNLRYFVRFAERMFQEFGADVRYFCVLQEPEVYVRNGWFKAEHPPGKQASFKGFEVYRNLYLVHRKIYRLAHKTNRRIRIGAAFQIVHGIADDDRLLTRWSLRYYQLRSYAFFLRRIRRSLDWIGVNYFVSQHYVGRKAVHAPDATLSDLGWEVNPEHLEQVLERVGKKYKVPLIVTESGIADEQDAMRKQWITHSILAINRARKKGIKVEGYFYRGLFDVVEWSAGKWPRFGLVAVDYKTMKRTPRASALWYAKILKNIRGLS